MFAKCQLIKSLRLPKRFAIWATSKKEGITLPTQSELLNQYIGRWFIIDRKNNIQHSLEFTTEHTLFIDNSIFDYTVVDISYKNLVIRDKFGYLITVSCENKQPVSLFDEANNRLYAVEK